MNSISKKSIVKRVYQKGTEITVSAATKKKLKRRKVKTAAAAAKKKLKRRKVKTAAPKAKKNLIPKITASSGKNKTKYSRPKKIAKNKTIKKPAINFKYQPIVDNYDFPSTYNNTMINLMIMDPHWVYASWEISETSYNALSDIYLKQDIEKAKTVLRMYDVTLINFNGSNANSYFDIEVGPFSSNWYVNLWKDGMSYVADIGMLFDSGHFHTLARSNCVIMPRINISPRSEQIWMEVSDQQEKRPFVIAYDKQNFKNKNINTTPQKRKIIFLTEEAVKQYYMKISYLLKDIIANKLNMAYGKRNGKYGFIMQWETEEEKRRILSLFPESAFKRIRIGASEELFLGGSNLLSQTAGASESLLKPIDKFFFEINTELIVYGRTEKDAEVRMGDKKIHLNPDGTFSMRFALADGYVPLNFKAVSKNKKHSRKINTSITRQTKYLSSAGESDE